MPGRRPSCDQPMMDSLFESSALDRWHRSLNAKDKVPPRGFRRNVTIYPLVCYVNNIVGCYLGRNADPIMLFIERGREHMSRNPPSEEWGRYYEMASEYFDVMEQHLRANGVTTIYD